MPLAVLRPPAWEWLLFVHLAGALLYAGALTAIAACALVAARRESPREVALLARVVHLTTTWLAWPALLVAVGAGSALAGRERVWSESWVSAGFALTIVLAALAGVVLARDNLLVLRRAEALAAEGVERSDDLTALKRRLLPRTLAPASLVLVAAIVYLMTARPGA